MISVHTTPEEFEDATIIIGHFGFVFEENSSTQITKISRSHRFRKTPFLISVDGRPNRINKLRFEISAA